MGALTILRRPAQRNANSRIRAPKRHDEHADPRSAATRRAFLGFDLEEIRLRTAANNGHRVRLTAPEFALELPEQGCIIERHLAKRRLVIAHLPVVAPVAAPEEERLHHLRVHIPSDRVRNWLAQMPATPRVSYPSSHHARPVTHEVVSNRES